MSDLGGRLADGWAHLEARGGDRRTDSDGWCSYDTGVSALERSILLALDGAGAHHLLIPCAMDAKEPAPNRGALSMECRDFHFGSGATGPYLDIRCTSATLSDHFRTVVADVVDRVSDSRDPARVAPGVVAEWRRLFAELGGRESLTYKRRISLFAELTTLLEIADVRGHLDARWWTGPQRRPHDIELPDLSVEVKAVGEDSMTVRFHGVEQLAELDDKPLLLLVRTVVESEEGTSPEKLADEVVRASVDPSAARLKMLEAGLTPDAARHPGPKFVIAEDVVVRVGDDIPRLTPDVMGGAPHPAITAVTYDVDLATLAGLGLGVDSRTAIGDPS